MKAHVHIKIIVINITKDLQYERRNNIQSPDIESTWIEIKLKNSKPFLFSSVYRPPSSKAEWLESFSKQMEKALSISVEVYIMGDINIDCKNNDFQNNTWKHIVQLHDLQQLIKTPTRVTAHTETIIDHLYASNSDFVYDVSVRVGVCFYSGRARPTLNWCSRLELTHARTHTGKRPHVLLITMALKQKQQ